MLVILTGNCAVAAASSDLGGGWSAVAGEWLWRTDLRTLLVHKAEPGFAAATCDEVSGGAGAWRCAVEPSMGTLACGIAFPATDGLAGGLRCQLGGEAPCTGFSLRTADGRVLWNDEWAPWAAYNTYWLEGVVERGRVRVQMLAGDGKTLLSQSPWIDMPAGGLSANGVLGVFCQDGAGRFRGAELSGTPLSSVVDNPPNLRRLPSPETPDWTVSGQGSWMFATVERVRIRQQVNAERAWAFNKAVSGADRIWRCNVRVSPGAGGAGMTIQTDELHKDGFICWLGGTFGAGCLMIYRNDPQQALWAGEQDKWHYDTDYVLEAETRSGGIRARLLSGDGATFVSESPWVDAPEELTDKPGFIGFHTWKGPADFWGWREGAAAGAVAQVASALGADWSTPSGSWEWANAEKTAVRQTGTESASALCSAIRGSKGTWRCTVVVPEGSTAGLLFQAGAGLTEGFRVVLGSEGLALLDLALPDRTRWQDAAARWTPGTPYVLEGKVVTDRVTVRLLSGDGRTVVSESPALYVSDRNNTREGVLGFASEAGPAEFSSWSFVPGE